jgi:DNA modification methylase
MEVTDKSVCCKIICGDSRKILPTLSDKVQLLVTSPPYADARKSHYDSIHPDEYAAWFMDFHKPFWDILDNEGSFVLNIKDKTVNGIRHRFVWETIKRLEEAGWKAIDDYIWYKTNPMPGHWPSRLRDGWEYCFHLAKTIKPRMYQDNVKVPIGGWTEARLSNLKQKDRVRQNSANKSGFGRDISYWVDKSTVFPSNVLKLREPEAEQTPQSNVIDLALVGKNYQHPAVFPVGLPAFFIRLFTAECDMVLDPFCGSGTTGIAAINLQRNSILIDNNEKYCQIAYNRIKEESNLNGSLVVKEGF